MLFEMMPFVMQGKKSRKLNPNESEPSMRAFWNKMDILEKHVPQSKKNMVIDSVVSEGWHRVKIYGGEV